MADTINILVLSTAKLPGDMRVKTCLCKAQRWTHCSQHDMHLVWLDTITFKIVDVKLYRVCLVLFPPNDHHTHKYKKKNLRIAS